MLTPPKAAAALPFWRILAYRGAALRPPMCFICLRTPDDEASFSSFETIGFALTPQEEAASRERDREGWAGHPSEVEWFCHEHSALAKKHSHLHWREAMELLAQQRRQLGEAH
ncbi:hypothetical protein [Actinomadura luteofluorescens]|uniref:hypothetical protein n=1 Tax=Actinomadura luteofluorescens TaxID=46163 RepID=UPI003D8DC526